MQRTFTAILIWTGLILGLPGCGGSSSDASTTSTTSTTATTATTSTDVQPSGTVTCTAPLVAIQTGSNSSCAGGNTHAWPLGLKATDCHGWRGVDTSGAQHDNSANNIRCNGDGSFSFDQHAGTLTCNNPTPVTKTYRTGQCAQDIPPSLYSIPLNLSCCTAPGSASCTSGTPSVGAGSSSTVYLNNKTCAP